LKLLAATVERARERDEAPVVIEQVGWYHWP
jgi:hypothetical protein